MEGLSVAASLAGIISLGIHVTQSLVDFYTAYKDQQSHVARTIKKLEHLLNLLKSLHEQLTGRQFRPDEHSLLESIEDSIKDCQEYIDELQIEILKFKVKSTDGIKAVAQTSARRLAYPLRQSTLQKLDEDVNEAVCHLSLALQVLQQNDIGNVQDNVEDTKALLDLVRSSQVSSDIREWLRAPDATKNYNEACQKKHPGTGLWFVKSSSFSSWLTSPNSFLWLNGFAGCGKSVLCSTAIQYAFRHRSSNPRIGLAFFFFTFNDDTKQDASAMLRSLVVQLSCQLNDKHGLLSQWHNSYRNAMPPNQVLMDCLYQHVRAFEQTYIISDALDESPLHKDRGDMLQRLVDMRGWSERGLHLLVTSRDEPDIRRKLCALPHETISMKNDLVDNDIADFISHHLKHNEQLEAWEEYYDKIENVLTKGAKGVSRVLPGMRGPARPTVGFTASVAGQNVRTNALEYCPGFQYAQRILTLLCYAKRPLTVSELIDGIAVDLREPPTLNPKRKLKDINAIHKVCPGLIEVDVDPRDSWTTVRIAHFSVQEYLESERAVATFRVRRSEAHAEIALICLTYLLEAVLSKEPPTEYPLALYAASTWPEHFRDGDVSNHNAEHQVLQLFRSPRGEFERWVKIRGGYGSYGDKFPLPIYYASLLGLDFVLSKLLCESPSTSSFSALSLQKVSCLVNEPGGVYGNALQAASVNGHEKVVELLLRKGADVNAHGGMYGNALFAASVNGHEKVVELLLDRGADLNSPGVGDYYVHDAAAEAAKTYEKVAEMLLGFGKGAVINAQDRHYVHRTWQGSMGWSKGELTLQDLQITLILLEGQTKRRLMAAREEDVTALYAASLNGHEKVVELLLGKGANVNAQGGIYGNALQAASYHGREKVVRLLLSKGADVNAQGGECGSALQAASYNGQEKLVELLLGEGADVDVWVPGRPCGTALFVASDRGHEKVVELLLRKGADVNTRVQGRTTLQAASFKGHEKVIQLLQRPQHEQRTSVEQR
ncbi:hypothetical protein PV08_02064 [Exophiala spinifera]|uniref:NACHT domain-containing protein n=1 Tax=Exophiala spinifera TaxID=91928 RepID=A0A0D2CD91_9EURO|nr:uncharacterized protein PV08_02064 [Exophiala spinifera]KIW21484.1 hypothetical protein PV08_02064 [Exophiala spinifera]